MVFDDMHASVESEAIAKSTPKVDLLASARHGRTCFGMGIVKTSPLDDLSH